jgi:hypothetical protein
VVPPALKGFKRRALPVWNWDMPTARSWAEF